MKIILASTSPYRAQQLHNLGLPFTVFAPQFDEEAYKTKSRLTPVQLSRHLAREKARSIYGARLMARPSRRVDTVVIGADQLACIGKEILGKPHNRKNAIEMLTKMQGRRHKLITSICAIGPNVQLLHDIHRSVVELT